jgi:Ca2+-binding RTX toxin-like protein
MTRILSKTIAGTAGDDNIAGTGEDDVIRAGAGKDLVVAGAGHDEVDGEDGDDILHGEEGNDSLSGGRGTDTLVGSSGNDMLDIRFDPAEPPSADLLYGGTGDDVYGIDAAGDIVFEDFGAGSDTAMVRIQNGGWYAHAHVERIFAASDTLTFLVGNEGANDIRGGAAGELLLGGGGNDTVRGGGGNDLVFGETGDDTLFGGAGIDYIVGGAGADQLWGELGADALYGEDGDDRLVGGPDFATDILVGGAGNDDLNGNSGHGDYDLMDGGAGNDLYFVDTPDDLTFEAAGGGTDTVYATVNGAGVYLYAHVEKLYIWGNTSFGVGNELDNFISARGLQNEPVSEIPVALLGGAGNDTIFGNDVTNGIYGEDGNDNLYGNGGNDVIDGGAGNDHIDGGDGSDVMVGGGGGDIFVIGPHETATNIDYILDFEDGADRIQIDGYHSFEAVAPHISQQGADTVIDSGMGRFLVLQNVNMAALSGADFIF